MDDSPKAESYINACKPAWPSLDDDDNDDDHKVAVECVDLVYKTVASEDYWGEITVLSVPVYLCWPNSYTEVIASGCSDLAFVPFIFYLRIAHGSMRWVPCPKCQSEVTSQAASGLALSPMSSRWCWRLAFSYMTGIVTVRQFRLRGSDQP